VQATKPKKAMELVPVLRAEQEGSSSRCRCKRELERKCSWSCGDVEEPAARRRADYVELSAADQERQREPEAGVPAVLPGERRSPGAEEATTLAPGLRLSAYGQPMGPRKGRPPKLPSFTPAYTQQPLLSASYSQQPAVSSSADVADICKSVLQLQQNCVQQLNQQQACLQQVVAFLHNFTHTAALPHDTAPQDEAFNYPTTSSKRNSLRRPTATSCPTKSPPSPMSETELPYYEAYNTFETSFIEQCQKTTPGLSATQMQDYARAEWDSFRQRRSRFTICITTCPR